MSPPPPSCRLFFYPFKTGPSLDTSQSRTVRADAAGIQGGKIFLSRPNVLGHFQGIGCSVPRLTWTGSLKEPNRDGPPLKGWFAHLRLKAPSHVHHGATLVPDLHYISDRVLRISANLLSNQRWISAVYGANLALSRTCELTSSKTKSAVRACSEKKCWRYLSGTVEPFRSTYVIFYAPNVGSK